jgi:uncharacterized protein (DUF1778 family)
MEKVKKLQTRFDTRLSMEQKKLFENAASIGGYRNLTDFIIHTVQEKAYEIIKSKEQIISSEKDAAVFFNALDKTSKPSKVLKNAVKDYETFKSKLK